MTKASALKFILPLSVLVGVLSLWSIISYIDLFPAYALPSPRSVLNSFREELMSGRLVNDIIASLWRVAVGFTTASVLGIPLGLWLGQKLNARNAFVPMLNF